MKKYLLIIPFFLLLGSCSSKKMVVINSSIIDYSEYAKNGFFITESPSVSFEYTPIGSIYVEASSGYEMKGKMPNEYGVVKKTYEYKNITIYDALNELQKKCNEVGANGVINLKIDYKRAATTNFNNAVTMIAVSGMAIKR